MRKTSVLLGMALLLFLVLACHSYKNLPSSTMETDWRVRELPSYPQVEAGNPAEGFNYLITGDYIGTGMPYEMFKKQFAKTKAHDLNRTGDNAGIPFYATVFEANNGVKVANGNCFTCHAGYLDGQLILGLGNHASDYRKSMAMMANVMNTMMNLKYRKDDPEYKAFEDFGHYFKAMAPEIQTNQPGVNPAFRLAEACMKQRNPQDLTWRKEAFYDISTYNIATDVPPLWNMKKKNALYYTGVGRGDLTKLLLQASVLGVPDSAAARRSQEHFRDVVAWINQLEPPVYPQEVISELVAEGEAIFNENCSTCHGTYGEIETYPNKLVSVNVVKTDPLYATYGMESGIIDWYNQSWFATSEPKSWFEPSFGYVAPPLDGIWATAPYLHNGSVPTLEDLLNSKQRPTYWKRDWQNSKNYDYTKIGWQYERLEKPDKDTYDTTLPGYSNAGHNFGDKLTNEERKAVLEYLKTL